MQRVKVKGYSYSRNGRTIFVKPYTRTCEGSHHSGEEFSSLKKSNGLLLYNSWEDFQKDINEVGWENMTLYKGRKYTVTGGKKTLNINDPRGYDPENRYVGFRVRGKLVGAANMYVSDGNVEIGDFEIFPKYKRKGYGRKFFNAIRKQHPTKDFTLLWGNKKAKKFWESVGFKSFKNCRVMELCK